MDKLTDVINYFKTIDLKQVIDILIAIAIIIFFYIFSSGLSYILIRIFKRNKTDKERIKKMPFYKPLKIFFIVLLSLTVFCFSSAKTTNNISIPKEVKYSGVLRDSITFTDSLGTHILITSELENAKERSSYIFAYDYLKKDKNMFFTTLWEADRTC